MKHKHLFILLSLLTLSGCTISFNSSSSSLESSSTSSDSLSSSSSSKEDSSTSSDLSNIDNSLIYDGYYSSLVSWDNGTDLIKKLHDIISSGNYTPIQYAGSYTNWFSNQDADINVYDREYLDVVYSGEDVLPSNTNNGWQREHAFPASLMCGTTTGEAVKTLGRATDFHNLFAAGRSGNASRGNKNFGNADTLDSSFKDFDYENGGYRYDSKNFEPAKKDKGRLSRAIFYMATMYSESEGSLPPIKVQEEYVTYSSSDYSSYAIGNLSTLLSWSDIAVDLLEYQHNESVYSFVAPTHSDPTKNVAQGNRNPYVDFPELVSFAFGEKKDNPGSLKDLTSSYETLNISDIDNPLRTIKTAKRSYGVGDVFHKEDISVAKYIPGVLMEDDLDIELEGVNDNEVLNKEETRKVVIKTKNNELSYSFMVESVDPFVSSTYTYTLTGKSSGGDLTSIKDSPAIDNVVNLGGVNWIIRYEKGAVGNKNSTFGVAFGTAASPVETLTLESESDFEFDSKSLVESIYFKGSAASGCSYTLSFYLGSTFLSQSSLSYESGVAQVLSSKLASPSKGKVKIVITNITKAVYVHSLAVNLL